MEAVQIIEMDGRPAFAVVPYAQYLKLAGVGNSWRERDTIPHEVVSYMVKNDVSRLKAWRVFLGKTQKDMAEAMNITQGSYSAIENFKSNQRATLEKAAKALGISFVQLGIE